MVEFKGARIALSGPHRTEFGMTILKAPDVGGELDGSGLALQVRMTLCASRIRRLRQSGRTLVLDMTIHTLWRERLLSTVYWSVVATQATLVGYLTSEDCSL
jgi:hypothetical protein